jgi:hypothetical protein
LLVGVIVDELLFEAAEQPVAVPDRVEVVAQDAGEFA